jgi:uncharacterized membrane protein
MNLCTSLVTWPNRNRSVIYLAGILIIGASLRLWYAVDLPLNGDEVGVGVLQASGQARTYGDRLTIGVITPLKEIKGFLEYDPAFSPEDVLDSLRFAGMHPPFYYLVLHYTLRFFGNDALKLRFLSIVLSLGSLVAIYYLGKVLYSETAGLYGALFLAVSSYGVIYGSLVRPYILAMLLALVSTTVALNLSRRSVLSLGDHQLICYIALGLIGLYTVYQYFFILMFQLIYLSLVHLRQKRNLLALGFAVCLIGVGYLPWMPAFFTQIREVMSHRYYFNQNPDLWQMLTTPIAVNFSVYFSLKPLGIFLVLVVYACLGIGVYVLWQHKEKTRLFLIALGAYILLYVCVERLFHMNTLIFPKFLFFIVPIGILLLSVAISNICRTPVPRSFSMLCASGLLVTNSILISAHTHDWPAEEHSEEIYVRDFAPIVNSDHQRKLILLNTSQRRYLFAFVHALKGTGDVYLMDNKGVSGQIAIPDERELNRYSDIYLVNLYVDYDPETFLSEDQIEGVSEALRRENFDIIKSVTSGNGMQKNSLLVFEKAEGRQQTRGSES